MTVHPKTAVLLAATLLLTGIAHAHYPWLMPTVTDVPVGSALSLHVGFGHGPGEARRMDRDRVAEVLAIGPDGNAHTLTPLDSDSYATHALNTSGTVLLAATQIPDFYTNTPTGWVRDSRANRPDAIRCVKVANSFKAVVRVGEGTPRNAAITEPRGEALEIVPLTDPARQAPGAPLALRVLFKGQPFARQPVTLIDMTRPDGQPIEVTTDARGQATVSPARAGTWMVSAETTAPFDDPAVCDEHSYHATLVMPIGAPPVQ